MAFTLLAAAEMPQLFLFIFNCLSNITHQISASVTKASLNCDARCTQARRDAPLLRQEGAVMTGERTLKDLFCKGFS